MAAAATKFMNMATSKFSNIIVFSHSRFFLETDCFQVTKDLLFE